MRLRIKHCCCIRFEAISSADKKSFYHKPATKLGSCRKMSFPKAQQRKTPSIIVPITFAAAGVEPIKLQANLGQFNE